MMNTEYALKDGRLLHVSEVERGLKCDCVCPGCGEKMIARKGSIMAHHFAHQNAECSHGLETTLHLMAKAILEHEKRILLPTAEVPFQHRHRPIISEAKIIEFDEAILEKRYDDIIPDVMIRIGDKLLIIEIWVTHKVDEIKRKKIEESGISALEVNLSSLERMVSMEELRAILLENAEYKRWIYNRVAEDYKKKWFTICEKKRTIRRGYALHVDMCPIKIRVWQGRPYANVIDDCFGCDFCLDFVRVNEDEETVYCCGKTGVRTMADLKSYIDKVVTV